MNSRLTIRTVGVLSAAMVLGATISLASWKAYADDTTQPAQTQAAPAQKSMHMHKSHVERVQDRIKSLHDELHITAAQETQFGKVAQIMTANAQQESDLWKQRRASAKTATATDNLKSYEAIEDAKASGLKQLVPAFDDLYNALSDEQKKTADDLFRNVGAHRHQHPKKSG